MLGASVFLLQLAARFLYGDFSLMLLFCSLLPAAGILAACFLYFYRQNEIMETAAAQMESYLDGDTDARIDCEKEGELYSGQALKMQL